MRKHWTVGQNMGSHYTNYKSMNTDFFIIFKVNSVLCSPFFILDTSSILRFMPLRLKGAMCSPTVHWVMVG